MSQTSNAPSSRTARPCQSSCAARRVTRSGTSWSTGAGSWRRSAPPTRSPRSPPSSPHLTMMRPRAPNSSRIWPAPGSGPIRNGVRGRDTGRDGSAEARPQNRRQAPESAGALEHPRRHAAPLGQGPEYRDEGQSLRRLAGKRGRNGPAGASRTMSTAPARLRSSRQNRRQTKRQKKRSCKADALRDANLGFAPACAGSASSPASHNWVAARFSLSS